AGRDGGASFQGQSTQIRHAVLAYLDLASTKIVRRRFFAFRLPRRATPWTTDRAGSSMSPIAIANPYSQQGLASMNLAKLSNPSSFPVLGASEGPSIGRTIVQALERLGFAGRIYPVNPKYPRLAELPCYPSLRALPEPPDVVALCIGPDQLLNEVRSLAECGAGAPVFYACALPDRA